MPPSASSLPDGLRGLALGGRWQRGRFIPLLLLAHGRILARAIMDRCDEDDGAEECEGDEKMDGAIRVVAPSALPCRGRPISE